MPLPSIAVPMTLQPPLAGLGDSRDGGTWLPELALPTACHTSRQHFRFHRKRPKGLTSLLLVSLLLLLVSSPLESERMAIEFGYENLCPLPAPTCPPKASVAENLLVVHSFCRMLCPHQKMVAVERSLGGENERLRRQWFPWIRLTPEVGMAFFLPFLLNATQVSIDHNKPLLRQSLACGNRCL